MEKIVQTNTCKKCNKSFDITDKDLEFLELVSPKIWWQVFKISSPTLCPDCRQQRRLSFRNERKLYKSKCDLTGKDIISIYSQDKKYRVYESKTWWSDRWDWLDYWRDFDFSRSFFDQFDELLKEVPRINLHIQNEENSPYSNFESDMKNCYLTIWGHWNENCMYWTYNLNSQDSVDNYWIFKCNNIYEGIICYNSSNCFYVHKIENCNNCYFWYDLKWCFDCFWCAWLRNKKYHIFNKEYSREEYEKKVKEFDISNYKNIGKIRKKFREIELKTPHKDLSIVNSENCIWDDIFNSKNCINCFSGEDAEDCRYWLIFWLWKKAMDVSSVWMMEKFYECSSWWMHAYQNIFTQFSYTCKEVAYCDNCHYCSNCFACVWLRNKEYCIFNKQYTKQEYEELVPKIIDYMMKTWEWWEFFPSDISPFWYNESWAQEYYHLEKKDAKEKWFNWSSFEAPFPKAEKIISANKLPNYINDIPDDILNWAIECEVTKKPFRIIKPELEFYRRHKLSLPRKHPDVRHLDRMKIKNWVSLYDRKCDKCWIDIKTTYSQSREEIVYCEDCYNKEVY